MSNPQRIRTCTKISDVKEKSFFGGCALTRNIAILRFSVKRMLSCALCPDKAIVAFDRPFIYNRHFFLSCVFKPLYLLRLLTVFYKRLMSMFRVPVYFVALLCSFFAVHAQAKVVKGNECSAIQQAIIQLPQAGGEVQIPAGTFTCNLPIVIDRDNVTVRGAGSGTVLRLADGANAPVIIMGQAIAVPNVVRRNISVSDLTIDGNRQNQSSECMGGPCSEAYPLRNNGISIRHCHDCQVQRVTAHSTSSGGLVTELKSRRLTIRDFTSFNNQFDGLAGYETEDSIFSGLYLHNNLAAGFSFDIKFNKNVFNDIVIENSGSVGIFMRDSFDNLFSNMHISNSKQHGIFLAQVDAEVDKPAAGQTFNGLMVSGSGGYGVRVNDASCTDTLLVGAQLIGNESGCVSEILPGLITTAGAICR
jgi:hypothetical protein